MQDISAGCWRGELWAFRTDAILLDHRLIDDLARGISLIDLRISQALLQSTKRKKAACNYLPLKGGKTSKQNCNYRTESKANKQMNTGTDGSCTQNIYK